MKSREIFPIEEREEIKTAIEAELADFGVLSIKAIFMNQAIKALEAAEERIEELEKENNTLEEENEDPQILFTACKDANKLLNEEVEQLRNKLKEIENGKEI